MTQSGANWRTMLQKCVWFGCALVFSRHPRAIVARMQLCAMGNEHKTLHSVLHCRTVKELLWGYEDELLTSLSHLLPTLQERAWVRLLPNMTSAAEALALPRNIMRTRPRVHGSSSQVIDSLATSATVRRGRIDAFLQHSGDSVSAPAAHHGSGAQGVDWAYERWEGLSHIDCWHDHSEAVRGSDALQFGAGLTHETPVHVFVPELFRTVRLNVTDTVRLQLVLTALKCLSLGQRLCT